MTMSIGVLLGAGSGRAGEVRERVRAAEAAGLDHVAVGDHVTFYTGFGIDGLLHAALFVGASEEIEVNTAVYLLPLRHPVVVARQLADIGSLAPGRFTFGVGIGGEDPHEVTMCGVDPSTRGRRMDESIAVIRGLMTGEPFDFHGEFFDFDDGLVVPAPDPPIPIVVGGRSDAAIRRAGRLGDGWFGIWVSARRYGEVISEMETHASDAGRSGVGWRNALSVWCGIDRDVDTARRLVASGMEGLYRLPYERFERWSPHGPPAHIAEFLVPYHEAGCHVINLIVQATSPMAAVEGAAEVRQLLLDHVE